jgi:hypothetical protein
VKTLLIALAAMAAPAGQPQIDVGAFNAAEYPQLRRTDRPIPTYRMVRVVEMMLQQRQCRFEGQNSRHFNITVPYLAQVEPDGSVSRVVVANTGCEALESYVGSLAIGLGRLGDLRPSAGSEPQWYASEFNFTFDIND